MLSQPLSILNVSPVFCHPEYRATGVARTSFDLARAMARRGHRVQVVCPLVDMKERRSIPETREWEGGRLQVDFVPEARYTRFGTSAHGLRRVLLKYLPGCDLVHVHTFLSPWTDRTLRLARSVKKPYFVQPRGKLSPEMLANRGGGKSLYLKLGGQRLLRDAAAVMPLTETVGESLRRLDPRINVVVCPNGLDPREYADPGRERPIESPYILYLGLLDPRKRIDLLIEAFAKAKPEIGAFKLALVGGDKYGQEESLRRQIDRLGLADEVMMPGHVVGAEKLNWLAHAQLFALSSEGEGLSVAMIEALSFGVPCILSEGCNAPDVAEVGAGEILPLDADSWARSFRAWARDEPRRREASCAARSMFEGRFTIGRVAQRMERAYRGQLAGGAI